MPSGLGLEATPLLLEYTDNLWLQSQTTNFCFCIKCESKKKVRGVFQHELDVKQVPVHTRTGTRTGTLFTLSDTLRGRCYRICPVVEKPEACEVNYV